jgi:hypothetical protein
MSARSPASDLFPVAAAGLALLALGGLLLLIGESVSVGNPSEFDTWLVGVGLVVLLGAMLVVLIRSNPPPAKPPKSAAPTLVHAPAHEVRAAPAPDRVESEAPPPSSTRVPDPPPALTLAPIDSSPRPSHSGSTSIPAQYEAVRLRLPGPAESTPPWDDVQSAGVLLPFSAAGPQAARMLPDLDPPEVPLAAPPVDDLEREVARLREKVLALQRSERPTSGPAPPSPALVVPTAIPRRDGPRPPEPPTLSGASARRACVSCGSGLPGGATDPLCWGCGRPLCSTCYWRATEGAAAHTCPSCFAKAGTTSMSGGRGPATSGPTPVVSGARPKAATAPR